MTLKQVDTVAEVVARFEAEFSAFSEALVGGKYALWLGSAISRERMPDVWKLLEKVVDFLRKRAFEEGVEGPHARALRDVLDLAGINMSEPGVADVEQPCSRWPSWSDIADKLADKYDLVLNVPVGPFPDDYLVWTGLDVRGTYADPSKSPDLEHYCIALLLLEGVVTTAVTANWDGLIEKALSELTLRPDRVVRVIVKPDDFREMIAPKELIKFHGCAVLAASDPDEYRGRLVARNPQVQGFKVANPHMSSELEQRFSDQATLMMGLSTQDSNMHQMFSTASENLKRHWETEWPAVVLSEQTLRPYHRTLLTATYSNYGPENRDAIADGAVLGAYAKPVLVALVLWTLTSKLAELVDYAPMPDVDAAERELLKSGLHHLRDAAALHAGGGSIAFVAGLIDAVSTLIHVFRTGRSCPPGHLYDPVSTVPIAQAVHEQHFPTDQLGRLAVILALVGRGMKVDGWTAQPGSRDALGDGPMQVVSTTGAIRLFVVKDADAWATLTSLDDYDEHDPNVVVLYCGTAPLQTRESRGRRSGTASAALIHLADVCADASCADDLYSEFKQISGFA